MLDTPLDCTHALNRNIDNCISQSVTESVGREVCLSSLSSGGFSSLPLCTRALAVWPHLILNGLHGSFAFQRSRSKAELHHSISLHDGATRSGQGLADVSSAGRS